MFDSERMGKNATQIARRTASRMIIFRKFRRVSILEKPQQYETCWRNLEKPIKTEHVGEVLVSDPKDVVVCVCVSLFYQILYLFRP